MKRFLSICLVLCLIGSVFSLPTVASAVVTDVADTGATSGTTGDCTWTYDSSTYTLTISGNGAMGSYTSSSDVPWYSYKENIKTVKINSGVTNICGDAFYWCRNLTSVVIPDSVKSIGDFAFFYCSSLTSVTIGNGVTYIGSYAFRYCTSFTSVTIPNSVTNIASWAFDDCSNLKDVYYTGTSSQWNSISIGSNNSPLTSATIHYNSPSASGTTGDCTWTYDSSTYTLTISGNGAMGSYNSTSDVPWYSYRSSIKTVKINSGVRSIGDYAFYNFTILTSVTIPSSVTSIGNYAFCYCTSLTSVTIPNSVTSIGSGAFEGCKSLTSISVDSNNKYYSSSDGNLYNKNKTKLIQYAIGKTNTSFAIPSSVTSIGNYAFEDCTSLTSITISNSVTSIGSYAFEDCTSLTSITIPNSVTSIGSFAFGYCTSLTSITIPNSVTSIGNYAFYYCTSLTSITIPDSVTSIGSYAFEDCTSLTSITIPSSVTSIGNYAFEYCKSLTSITIPNSVTSIGSFEFGYCTSLTSITIPNSVTSIGNCAFYYCTSLKDVYYTGTSSQWNSISIGSNNSPLTSATIHYTDEYTITFNANGGSNAPSSITKNGTSTSVTMGDISSAVPTRTGYTFYGWSASSSWSSKRIAYSSSSGGATAPDGTTAKSTQPYWTYADYCTNTGGSTSSKTLVLYAQWKANEYTITYNANGGSGAPSSQTKTYGSTLYLSSTTPTRTGYTFLGWSTSSSATSATYSAGDSFTTNASITLYAVWKAEDTYTITFNANGGSNAPSSITKNGTSTSVTMGDISSAVPTRTGYTFYGWSASSSWSSKRIAYNSSSGGVTAPDGTTAKTTSSSWTYADYCTNTGGSTSSKTLVLYAQWKETTKPSGSISSVTNDLASSQTVTLSMSDNAGVAGYYWGTSSSYNSNTFTYTSSTSVTKTILSPGTYYLTVKDINGNMSDTTSVTFYKMTLYGKGVSVTPSIVIIKSGNSFTLPTLSRIGYSFLGWSTSSSATIATHLPGSKYSPTSNTNLYAVWKETTKPYGSISVTNDLASSQTVTLSMSDNAGVAGYYWGTSSSYNSNAYSYAYASYGAVTKTISNPGKYYFTVKDINDNLSDTTSVTFYSTTLMGNGVSVAKPYIISEEGTTFTLPKLSRKGYIFLGWSTSINATSAMYSAGNTYYVNSNTAIYGVWKVIPSQTISAKSFTKCYGDKTFSIGAKAKTKLSYKSSDTKVATVSSAGKITIKGIGKATITITAAATSQYKAATKKITITVKPKAVPRVTYSGTKSKLTVKWSKISKTSGYEIVVSYNKSFNDSITKSVSKNFCTITNGQKKSFYIKIRAFGKYKNAKYYSDWKTFFVKLK